MAGINLTSEPDTAPEADRWYDLTLGSSFKDHNPSRFRTFRYEFKPASIDKNQRGKLHKRKDNSVKVEFQNIQPGKPKMIFDGTSEDYKENDAVLFFDGESFRLEKLHRAVKRLRHNRESAGPIAASDPSSPPVGKGTKHQPLSKEAYQPMAGEFERIEVGDFKNSDMKPRAEKPIEYPTAPPPSSSNPSPDPKNNDDDLDEHLDIMNDDDDDLVEQLDIMNDDEEDNSNYNNTGIPEGSIEVKEIDFDINSRPHHADTDDEIADVDVSDDEVEKGPNAAEALRAQVNAQGRDGSSSSSSGSSSESSGSGSSSSASESSDADVDAVNSD